MYTVALLIYTMLPSLKTLSRPLPARNGKKIYRYFYINLQIWNTSIEIENKFNKHNPFSVTFGFLWLLLLFWLVIYCWIRRLR